MHRLYLRVETLLRGSGLKVGSARLKDDFNHSCNMFYITGSKGDSIVPRGCGLEVVKIEEVVSQNGEWTLKNIDKKNYLVCSKNEWYFVTQKNDVYLLDVPGQIASDISRVIVGDMVNYEWGNSKKIFKPREIIINKQKRDIIYNPFKGKKNPCCNALYTKIKKRLSEYIPENIKSARKKEINQKIADLTFLQSNYQQKKFYDFSYKNDVLSILDSSANCNFKNILENSINGKDVRGRILENGKCILFTPGPKYLKNSNFHDNITLSNLAMSLDKAITPVDGRFLRRAFVSLKGLDIANQHRFLASICSELTQEHKCIAMYAIHDSGNGNKHAHILYSSRVLPTAQQCDEHAFSSYNMVEWDRYYSSNFANDLQSMFKGGEIDICYMNDEKRQYWIKENKDKFNILIEVDTFNETFFITGITSKKNNDYLIKKEINADSILAQELRRIFNNNENINHYKPKIFNLAKDYLRWKSIHQGKRKYLCAEEKNVLKNWLANKKQNKPCPLKSWRTYAKKIYDIILSPKSNQDILVLNQIRRDFNSFNKIERFLKRNLFCFDKIRFRENKDDSFNNNLKKYLANFYPEKALAVKNSTGLEDYFNTLSNSISAIEKKIVQKKRILKEHKMLIKSLINFKTNKEQLESINENIKSEKIRKFVKDYLGELDSPTTRITISPSFIHLLEQGRSQYEVSLNKLRKQIKLLKRRFERRKKISPMDWYLQWGSYKSKKLPMKNIEPILNKITKYFSSINDTENFIFENQYYGALDKAFVNAQKISSKYKNSFWNHVKEWVEKDLGSNQAIFKKLYNLTAKQRAQLDKSYRGDEKTLLHTKLIDNYFTAVSGTKSFLGIETRLKTMINKAKECIHHLRNLTNDNNDKNALTQNFFHLKSIIYKINRQFSQKHHEPIYNNMKSAIDFFMLERNHFLEGFQLQTSYLQSIQDITKTLSSVENDLKVFYARYKNAACILAKEANNMISIIGEPNIGVAITRNVLQAKQLEELVKLESLFSEECYLLKIIKALKKGDAGQGVELINAMPKNEYITLQDYVGKEYATYLDRSNNPQYSNNQNIQQEFCNTIEKKIVKILYEVRQNKNFAKMIENLYNKEMAVDENNDMFKQSKLLEKNKLKISRQQTSSNILESPHTSFQNPEDMMMPSETKKEKRELHAVIDNVKYTFREIPAVGDGFCAMNAANIKNPKSAIINLINYYNDPKKDHKKLAKIKDLISCALYNNLQNSSIVTQTNQKQLLESFDINCFKKDTKNKILELYKKCVGFNITTDNDKKLQAEAEFFDYLKRDDVQKPYLKQILKHKHPDNNIANACALLNNNHVYMFMDYGDKTGRLTPAFDNDCNIQSKHSRLIILHPSNNMYTQHYNGLIIKDSINLQMTDEEINENITSKKRKKHYVEDERATKKRKLE